jgi:hypothetical protein
MGRYDIGWASCSMPRRNRPYSSEAQMSMSTAEKYARRARNSDSLEDVAYNVAYAIDELVQAIRDLEMRIKRLESRVR